MRIFRKPEKRLNEEFLKSGSENLDYILGGGFPAGVVAQIYGEAGSGKSNICMSAAVNAALRGEEIIFIDTESSFNRTRFEQIAKERAAEVAKRIYLHRPKNLGGQRSAIEKLEEIDRDFSLVIIDSFVALYRIELRGGREQIIPFGRELGKQLSVLSSLAREKNCAVIVTNQVYDSFQTLENETSPSGGGAMEYWSKIILEIEKHGKDRLVTLKKHPFREDGESIRLKMGLSRLLE